MLKELDRAVLNFCSISRYRSSNDFQLHESNLPAFSTATILRSLAWIARKVPAPEGPSAQDFPSVNEQLRLLNGISVWIAYYPVHFTD
jgi:ataxia telangiectasia mutated family protein